MAKNKSKPKREKRPYGSGLIFVLNNLSAEHLNRLDNDVDQIGLLDSFMSNAVDNGLDIKLSWDDYSDCYQATAIGNWKGFPSEGFAVSARSDLAVDALIILAYKVVIIAEFNLSDVDDAKTADSKRG